MPEAGVLASIRFEGALSGELVDRLRHPIERATASCPAACDVFVYAVSPAPAVMMRVTVGQAVLPLLFDEHDLDPNRVLAALKGALANAQY